LERPALFGPRHGLGRASQGVKAWIHDTHAFLQQYSPEAAEFFLQQPKADYFTVADNIVFWTNVLFERIEHLRHVIETPDVYF